MTDKDRIACIALTFIPGVGSITSRALLAHTASPSEVFTASARQLTQADNVGTVLVKAIRENAKPALEKAEAIFSLCQSKKIEVLCLPDDDYPRRLREAPDAPLVLYSAGTAPQEATRILSIVGTRKNSPYGKRMTQEIIEGLAGTDITIVSGLAFGIDTLAHQASLANSLKTFAVLATPLDKVYPAQNRELAIDIFKTGRLYSEYAPGSKIDARNFPMRNRIIAGLADATLVVEAGATGGALITANLAQDYDREVFAVPGRIGDEASVGCLDLIAANKSAVFTSVPAFLEAMSWQDSASGQIPRKKALQLPEHLSSQEVELMKTLATPAGIHIDDLSFRTGVGLNILAGMLLKLEFEGLVTSLPGKKFAAAHSRP